MDTFCPCQIKLRVLAGLFSGTVLAVAVQVPPEGVEHCRTIVEPLANAEKLAAISETPVIILTIDFILSP
ncbi:hypothetical protein SAMN05192543_104288 [Paraburkholderia megapolitana]|uniref:Uncharacterized protein n=1 Tax=Paraburkholderia megapolitana TaxID=420953 RepID=A0A1I3L7Y2_9BURK|nr:hypothetical protein SAMN05192543_104288 [Paraburkholderia megapolitana]